VGEEGYGTYGISAEIAARLQEQGFDYLDAPIKRVAQLEAPLPYSRDLEQMALINADRVIDAVKETI
jgi:pyruvate dehydrogenase E1 component beta subunit